MKKMWVAAVAAAVVSCGIEEMSQRPGVNRDDVWTGPGMNAGDSGRIFCDGDPLCSCSGRDTAYRTFVP